MSRTNGFKSYECHGTTTLRPCTVLFPRAAMGLRVLQPVPRNANYGLLLSRNY